MTIYLVYTFYPKLHQAKKVAKLAKRIAKERKRKLRLSKEN